jgi:hypothetical protein
MKGIPSLHNNSKNIVRQDVNFLENPLWKTDNRDDRHEFSIDLPSGKYVYKAGKDDIPDDVDALFLYYFLLVSQSIKRSVIRMTGYRILKELNFPTNNKSYERLKACLRRWGQVSIHFQGSFYVIEKVMEKGKDKPVEKKIKRHVDKYFHILKAEIVKDESGKGKKTGHVKIEFDEDFLQAIDESLFIKHIDLKTFIALRSPFARRLYEWLPKQFIKRDRFEIGVEKFFAKMRMAPTTYPSVLKRKLKTIKTALHRINKHDTSHQYQVNLKVGKNQQSAFVFQRSRNQHSELTKADSAQLQLPEIEKSEIENQKLFDTLTGEFGISNNKAAEILKTKDEFYILDVLESVRDQINEGKVKNVPAFTVKAIEDDYRRKKSKDEIEKEEEQARKAQAKKDKETLKKLKAEFDAHFKSNVKATLNSLGEKETAQLIQNFEKDVMDSANQFLRKSYRKKGVEATFIQGIFYSYAAKKYLSPQDFDFILFAKEKGYVVEKLENGEHKLVSEK